MLLTQKIKICYLVNMLKTQKKKKNFQKKNSPVFFKT